MLRNVFLKTLRDERKALIAWAIGMAVLAGYTLVFFPFLRDNTDLTKMMQSLPPALRSVYGQADFSTGSGYLGSAVFNLTVPVLFLIYGITQGASAIAGEEDRRTLDLLLANPVSRTSVLLAKFGAICTALAGLGVVLWLTLWIGGSFVQLNVLVGNLAAATLSGVLLGVVGAALTLAVGAATGNRGLSLGIGAAVAFAGYLLRTLAASIPELADWQKLSPFYYYNNHQPLINGLSLGNAAVFVVAAGICVVVAVALFTRRDLAV
ncbi:MAG: ABC transporter permease [Chloroflexota bacterium]|nr:ABC transporter permease [Chloroflexota bacterium]